MTDTMVKPVTQKITSCKKVIQVKKNKNLKNIFVVKEDLFNEENEINTHETECLLRSTLLNVQKACVVEDEDQDQEDRRSPQYIQPVDRFISLKPRKKSNDYDKVVDVVEEDIQDYVVVGCRIPNGLVISFDQKKLLLRGINDMPKQEKNISDQNVGFTKVIRAVWKNFLKTHQNWSPLLNGLIFVVNK